MTGQFKDEPVMELQKEALTIRGVTFEVREMPISEMAPLMQRMADDPTTAQVEILKKSVYVDDTQLGEMLMDYPGVVFIKLNPIALRLNGISTEKSDEESEGNVSAP